MKLNTLVLTGLLGLAGLSVLSAKSYDIILNAPAQAGTLTLPSGEYKVKLEGANALFTKTNTGEKFTAPVKVSNANRKFDYTAVDEVTKGGTEYVKAIELGGSTTELEFAD